MQVVLVMFRGEGERRSFSIVRDVTVIGRREDCDFRIPLGEISRKHCRLIKDGEVLRAEDLGSSNGTYVNGLRVQEAELSPGDTLKVGSVVFVVQIDGVPSEENLQPATPSAAAATHETDAPPHEHVDGHELLNPTDQVDAAHADHESDLSAKPADEFVEQPETDHAPEHGDEPTIDEQPAEEPMSTMDPAEQYDPMSVLAADPDASSIGSMIENDHIAEDLIIELESQEHGQANNPV